MTDPQPEPGRTLSPDTCRIEGCDEPSLVPGACYDHCYGCPNCGQPVRFLTDHVGTDCHRPEDSS